VERPRIAIKSRRGVKSASGRSTENGADEEICKRTPRRGVARSAALLVVSAGLLVIARSVGNREIRANFQRAGALLVSFAKYRYEFFSNEPIQLCGAPLHRSDRGDSATIRFSGALRMPPPLAPRSASDQPRIDQKPALTLSPGLLLVNRTPDHIDFAVTSALPLFAPSMYQKRPPVTVPS